MVEDHQIKKLLLTELFKGPSLQLALSRPQMEEDGVYFIKMSVFLFNLQRVAIEYTQHLIEQKAAQEKKLEELRKEVLALKIMKS